MSSVPWKGLELFWVDICFQFPPCTWLSSDRESHLCPPPFASGLMLLQHHPKCRCWEDFPSCRNQSHPPGSLAAASGDFGEPTKSIFLQKVGNPQLTPEPAQSGLLLRQREGEELFEEEDGR